MTSSRRVPWVAALALVVAVPAAANSLWPDQAVSLFTDNKAYRVGDVLTVIVIEEAKVQNSSGRSLSKETNTEGEIETVEWPNTTLLAANKPKVKWKSKRSFDGEGSYQLAGKMETRLTAVVLDVLPNGNLVIEGSRLQQSVDEKVFVRVSGIVRPADVRSDNSVLSTALAEGKIVFESKGPIDRSNRRGILNHIVDFLWPF